MYKHLFKRIFDFFIAFWGIICLSPIFILIAILVKAGSKGPVFFKQSRIGKDKKLFTILKFRTMYTDTPKDMPTHMFENAEAHITKIGKFLRKTSLDELPQLFNILIGNMALIGPRPALYNQDDLIAERDKYSVNDLRPGLTGWAQVNGRDELPIEEKARLDGEYADKIGIFFDAKIFFMTLLSVVKSDGVKEGKKANETDDSCVVEGAKDAEVEIVGDTNETDDSCVVEGVKDAEVEIIGDTDKKTDDIDITPEV